MTVREIVEAYLREHGYDGLWEDTCEWEGCGCELSDLAPCGEMQCLCKPGYLQHHTREQVERMEENGPDCEGGEACRCVGPVRPPAVEHLYLDGHAAVKTCEGCYFSDVVCVPCAKCIRDLRARLAGHWRAELGKPQSEQKKPCKGCVRGRPGLCAYRCIRNAKIPLDDLHLPDLSQGTPEGEER